MINFRISSNQVREYWDGALNSAKSYIFSDLSEDAAKACEEVADAVLREKKGSTHKITSAAVGVMSKISVPAGLFGLAGLLGTASTGTAVGSLSGAAFTSSALAWLGGSIFAGTILVAASTVIVGIGGSVLAGMAFKKYWYGRPREVETLSEPKSRIVTSARALATGLRLMASESTTLTPTAADALAKNAIRPLLDELKNDIDDDSPRGGQRRLETSIAQLESVLVRFFALAKRHPNITIGAVSSAILAMLSNEVPQPGDSNYLVLAALQRSSNALNDATDVELAEYVQSLNESQLEGLISNVKGIYHEFKYAEQENLDGDKFYARVYEETNHAGADIQITNSETGEVTEVQLKATDYLNYVKAHQSRYSDIQVKATEEVASQSDSIESSGHTNAEITEDTKDAISGLKDLDTDVWMTSATLAGAISLSLNVRLLLKGKSLSKLEKMKLLKDTGTASLTAGFVSTFF